MSYYYVYFKNKSNIFNPITHNYLSRSLLNTGITMPRETKTINITSYMASLIFHILANNNIKFPVLCNCNTYRRTVRNWFWGLGRENIE